MEVGVEMPNWWPSWSEFILQVFAATFVVGVLLFGLGVLFVGRASFIAARAYAALTRRASSAMRSIPAVPSEDGPVTFAELPSPVARRRRT